MTVRDRVRGLAASFGWSSRPQANRGAWVWVLSACVAVAVAALALWQLTGMTQFDRTHHVSWLLLIPVFALAEMLVVHIDLHRETQTISLSEIPIVLSLVLIAPLELLAAQLIGAFLALTLVRRQAPMKLAFNLAQLGLAASVAVVVFRAFPLEAGEHGPGMWLAALAATLAADAVAIALMHAVFAIIDGPASLRELRAFVGFGVVTAVANTALALLAIVLVFNDPVAGALVLAPTAITITAYHGFWREHRRREHLEFLYSSMRRLSGATDIHAAVAQLLRDACEALRSSSAVVLLSSPDTPGIVVRGAVGVEGAVDEMREVSIDPAVLGAHGAGVVTHPAGALLPRLVAGSAKGDALSVELNGEHGPLGLLLVADRQSDVGNFTAVDRDLLRTYATHAGLALEHRHLQHSIGELSRVNDELVVKAFHDPLTQLPNRELFLDRLSHALEGDDGEPAAFGVLFVDLDDFKSINDTLGHAVGDQVLAAVAERLRACLRPGDTAARFGGDEFAVMCRLGHTEDADAVALRLTNALRQPVKAGVARVYVHASIGVAIGVAGRGDRALDLIEAADRTMYRIKFERKDLARAGGI